MVLLAAVFLVFCVSVVRQVGQKPVGRRFPTGKELVTRPQKDPARHLPLSF